MKIRNFVSKVFRKAADLSAPGYPKLKPRWVKVQSGSLRGANLYVDVKSNVYGQMASGVCDEHVFSALQETGVLREGAVIWDVGAHIGYDTLTFATIVGSKGRVIAFEPNPYNAKWLQQHLDKNPDLSKRIDLKPCAMTDFDGQLVFRFSPLQSLSQIGYLDNLGPPSDRIARKLYESMPTCKVSVFQADTLIEDGTRPPNCMKIDVEGAEAHVLRGAKKLIQEHKPVLAIEVHNIQLMFEVQEILHGYGYHTQFLEDIQHPSSSRGFIIAVFPC